MGIYKRTIYSTNDCSTDQAFIEIFDVAAAQTGPPGFDPYLGTPLKPANPDGSGLGLRDRPGTIVIVKAKASWSRDEDQEQLNVGNDPRSLLTLRLYTWDLRQRGLLINGVSKIKPNDRLIKIARWDQDVEKLPEWSEGAIRCDFTRGGRKGLFCTQVQHLALGAHVLTATFANRDAEMQ